MSNYSRLYTLAQKVYRLKKPKELQDWVNSTWDDIKNNRANFEETMVNLRAEQEANRQKTRGIWSFFGAGVRKRVENEVIKPIKKKKLVKSEKKNDEYIKKEHSKESDPMYKKLTYKPAQEKILQKITAITEEIVALDALLSGPNPTAADKVRKMRLLRERNKLKSRLARLRSLSKGQKKYREKRKKILVDNSLVRPASGRPPLEESGLSRLPLVILKIAGKESAADPRRRSEVLSIPRTLNDLKDELEKEGIIVKRSTLYTRLVPRRSTSAEGKRHNRCVPVQLRRAQFDGRHEHVSARFCFSTVRMLAELASQLGPKYCLIISPDDKATVPLGIPAATKQQTVLMALKYRVKLPDHQYVVASKHNLKPSVYALCVIKPSIVGRNDAVQYVGPTAIRIRSCKHDSSTAMSHLADFSDLLSYGGDDAQNECAMSSEQQARAVLILRPDGGPDQNPRHQKNQDCYIKLFKDNELDSLIIVLSPEGLSAFNPCERRMAPLSRELSGVMFDHQHFGNHLNSQKKTIDKDLEYQNFKYAGQALASLQSDMGGIGGHAVDAKQVDPVSSENTIEVPAIDEAQKCAHMIRSRYFVQITKCTDISCCGSFRSPLLKFLPNRFLPAPRVYGHNDSGELNLWKPELVDGSVHFASLSNILGCPVNQDIPFDTYNPKVKVSDLSCPFCPIQCCSPAELKRHRRALHHRMRADEVKEFELEELEWEAQVTEVIDECNGRYLCVMEDDEDVEWRCLPPTHPLIAEFKAKRTELLRNKTDELEIIKDSELDEFLACPWVESSSI